MSTTTTQQQPYLRQQRDFPGEDSKSLAVQCDRAYVDTAIAVNDRVIGTYAPNNQIVTGESWYLKGNREQQTLRQLYPITGTGSTPHGINTANIAGFTRIYGTFTDNIDKSIANWYPLPNVDSTVFTNQVSVQVTPTNIVITSGGIAIVNGWIILEWLSLV